MVTTAEADIFRNKISNISPVGVAILGRRKGEIVKVYAPDGLLDWEIVDIIE
ncbi:GreA/GreB family elongation factor [Carboxydothermus ferrireducens]|nr:GreA/GreB family elongation factor [Carboxydothermus ferrireducens]